MTSSPISNENIKIGYISETEGYVKDKTLEEANAYEELTPQTVTE